MKGFGSRLSSSLFDFLEITVIGLIISILVFLFVGQPLEVIGDSMLPTLKDGERIIAEKVTIKLEEPKRGDILIIRHPENPNTFVIKRLVGLPSETFKISNGNIYINNEKLVENYLSSEVITNSYGRIPDDVEIKIPSNSYILLGDNRNNSSDSRQWGPLDRDSIIGKSFLVYFPLSNIRIATR